ncbi:TonB-dependent receptor [Subsaximicrobium wynnwilliamsii]|uniref:TonB-dependent receptor n=1 Tax=Subsaximicrobium wynnwilliamsii TaxID=291179 RepID=A0A5C6ZIY1_9FLAO|nr:TonB-dependent receptor [Subsaximicrobium wynnwilliamsii]TXD83338.1 TonB-dependent receptor [Subsaximicrobium wynnwilliamsii]TXD89125.1 TonB-dependent receptor [Subsaximicrobium wynnwilliamsii]TXE03362.1 TonB-dependent receptor [Subsaximicrobium wynnwilliamsii]
MPNRLQHKLLALILVVSATTFAQEREKDSIDTETVNVVKAYTPTISDAFKIKETPNLNDSTNLKKKDIKYNIFSIPVASTFTPAKGKAAGVNKEKSVKLYDNYASVGLGTYATILGEVYLNHQLSRNERVGGYFSHHSSQGDIDGINYDNNFRETELGANYTQQQRDFTWKLEGGYELQRYNWYGLPDQTLPFFDVGHSFYNANIGGNIDFEDGIFNKATVLFRRFGDSRNSAENRFLVTSEFDVPVNDQTITTEVNIDYLSGGFDHTYFSETELNYGNFQLGVAPSYQFIQDDLTLNLGVRLVYFNDTEASQSKLHFYPNVTASYRLVDELLIGFGGIEGGLQQNSYFGFADENRFVAPTLFVQPTDQSYDVSAGIKGKLSNSMSYIVTGHYLSENNRALFKANPDLLTERKNYQFGNSFGVVYDDLKTFSFEGELNVDLNRNFKLGAKAAFFAYSTDSEAEAWNLPDLKASVFMDYQIDAHWFAGANLFFVGERKDQISEGRNPQLSLNQPQTVTLDSYFDANVHAGYKISDRLSAFVKGNNLVGTNYQRWLNYPVQGIQFLAGATYQFDF